MTTYILRRCVQAIPVLFGITLFTFLMVHLMPGDPVQAFAGDKPISPEQAEQIRDQYGLDKPLWEQYLTYMGDLVQGDLGGGLHNKRPVWDTIEEAIWPNHPTHARRARGRDRARRHVRHPGRALPQHLDRFGGDGGRLARRLAARLLSRPAPALRLLVPVPHLPVHRIGRMAHLVLPALTIGFASSAYIARLVRSSMLEVLHQDYIVTARAKGLAERAVVVRHALKNALIPAVTYFGIQLAGLLTGAVVTETVFSRPGLGRVAVTAIGNRDYPLIQGTVLVTALIYLAGQSAGRSLLRLHRSTDSL